MSDWQTNHKASRGTSVEIPGKKSTIPPVADKLAPLACQLGVNEPAVPTFPIPSAENQVHSAVLQYRRGQSGQASSLSRLGI